MFRGRLITLPSWSLLALGSFLTGFSSMWTYDDPSLNYYCITESYEHYLKA